jgi:hypothetical protein
MKIIEKKSEIYKSLRVTEAVQAKIIELQNKHWSNTGKKITVSHVIEDLLRTGSPAIPQPKPLHSRRATRSRYLAANRELHDKLEQILNSGDRGTLDAVVPNIELFFSRLRPAAGGADRKSRD